MLFAKKCVDYKVSVLIPNGEIVIATVWADENDRFFFEDYELEKQFRVERVNRKEYKYKLIHWDDLNDLQRKAIKKLEKLKVYKMAQLSDYDEDRFDNEFDFIWWRVLHELDLFTEHHDKELTHMGAKATKRWLEDYRWLTVAFNDVSVPNL